MGSQQALTSYHKPLGHAVTERLIRTLKEACLWLHEWPCPFASASALERWSAAYNEQDLHSTLGDKAPRPFEREYHLRTGTQRPAA
jgi:putative transposase